MKEMPVPIRTQGHKTDGAYEAPALSELGDLADLTSYSVSIRAQ